MEIGLYVHVIRTMLSNKVSMWNLILGLKITTCYKEFCVIRLRVNELPLYSCLKQFYSCCKQFYFFSISMLTNPAQIMPKLCQKYDTRYFIPWFPQSRKPDSICPNQLYSFYSSPQSKNAECALQFNCKVLLFPCRNPAGMSRHSILFLN